MIARGLSRKTSSSQNSRKHFMIPKPGRSEVTHPPVSLPSGQVRIQSVGGEYLLLLLLDHATQSVTLALPPDKLEHRTRPDLPVLSAMAPQYSMADRAGVEREGGARAGGRELWSPPDPKSRRRGGHATNMMFPFTPRKSSWLLIFDALSLVFRPSGTTAHVHTYVRAFALLPLRTAASTRLVRLHGSLRRKISVSRTTSWNEHLSLSFLFGCRLGKSRTIPTS